MYVNDHKHFRPAHHRTGVGLLIVSVVLSAMGIAMQPRAANATPSLAATRLAIGGEHSCALYDGGAVYCWGGNQYGQLGDGTTIGRVAPVKVSGLAGLSVIGISGGGHHNCVILAARSARCWGLNFYGELGDGANINRVQPVPVSGLTSVQQITGGDFHTCAILTDRTMKCWGANTFGQLGDGSVEPRNVPGVVPGVVDAVQIATDEASTCVRIISGVIKCWGKNDSGQLGNGTLTDVITPTTVLSITDAIGIAIGSYHGCAVRRTFQVYCWGANHSGQLGHNGAGSPYPSEVPGLTNAIAVVAADNHTCILRDSGKVACWGDNQFGQLGLGNNNDTNVPTDVVLPRLALQVAAKFNHTCALLDNGDMRCWGSNVFGSLGNGNDLDSNVPVPVIGVPDPPTATITITPTSVIPASITPTLTPANPKTHLPIALRQLSEFWQRPGELEPNNTAAEANGPLEPGKDYSALPDDLNDYFSVKVHAAGTVNLVISGHVGASMSNTPLQVSLRNSVGTELGRAFREPFNVSANVQPGTYYARVFFVGPYNENTPYVVRLTLTQ